MASAGDAGLLHCPPPMPAPIYRPRHRQRGERREREAPPDRIAAERRIGEPVKAETDRKHRQEQDNQWRHHRAIGAQRADHDDSRADGQESPCREIMNMRSDLHSLDAAPKAAAERGATEDEEQPEKNGTATRRG